MGRAEIGGTLKTALKIFGYQVAFGIFGFLFTPALIDASPAVRIPVVGILILAAGYLMFTEGAYRGERDCLMGETLEKLSRKGNYQVSPAEKAKRFNRVKGLLSAAIGALPVFLLAAVVAVTAKPYAYTLQDLPGWMTTYLTRAEVSDPLRYMQNVQMAASASDYIRVAVRFALFPYIGFLGTMSDQASLLFDRASPLLALLMPAACAIGYQFGPSRRAKSAKAIEEAKNRPRKRLKKTAKRNKALEEKKQLI